MKKLMIGLLALSFLTASIAVCVSGGVLFVGDLATTNYASYLSPLIGTGILFGGPATANPNGFPEQVFLNQAATTPEEWAAHDKGMPGALRGYRYAEDP